MEKQNKEDQNNQKKDRWYHHAIYWFYLLTIMFILFISYFIIPKSPLIRERMCNSYGLDFGTLGGVYTSDCYWRELNCEEKYHCYHHGI